jgi:Domain of unknown function (DUF4262)
MTDKFDAADQRVIDIVERVGWTVMEISPNKEDLKPHWFAYTVGLGVTFGWPELICFGEDLRDMGAMLNNAVEELKEKGDKPIPGMELTNVLIQFPVRLATFSPLLYRDHLGCAIWFADLGGLKPQQFSCLQVLWPDANGRFPDDPACDPDIRKLQILTTTQIRPH